MEQTNINNALSIVERIHHNYESLRNAEKTVADYLLVNSHTRLEISITEFSRKIGVSEATISRFSKALGYGGYPDLKLAIAAGAHATLPLPNMPSEILNTDSVIEAGTKLAAVLSLSIQETQKIINQKALESAVDALVTARRILFLGVGGAASICMEAMHLFNKAGRHSDAISDDYSQAICASTLKPGDVIVGVSHTGQTQSVANALSLASEGGFPTIALTSDQRSPVAQAADMALTTWKTGDIQIPLFGDFLEGRICQLFLIDLLYLMVLMRSENQEKDYLLKTGSALKDFYRPD